jgi:hypothetical protein
VLRHAARVRCFERKGFGTPLSFAAVSSQGRKSSTDESSWPFAGRRSCRTVANSVRNSQLAQRKTHLLTASDWPPSITAVRRPQERVSPWSVDLHPEFVSRVRGLSGSGPGRAAGPHRRSYYWHRGQWIRARVDRRSRHPSAERCCAIQLLGPWQSAAACFASVAADVRARERSRNRSAAIVRFGKTDPGSSG